MKTLKLIPLILLVFYSSFAFCQDNAEKVILSFEKKVSLFENFFSKPQYLLIKQISSATDVPFVYDWTRFEDSKISYDIKRSDSLISPYIGEIVVEYTLGHEPNVEGGEPCGDRLSKYGDSSSSIEIANKYKFVERCYERKWQSKTKVKFAYQRGKWVFKDVLDDKNRPALFINPIAKKMITRHVHPVEKENDSWSVLFE